ncbi:hypothetical protein PENTCL1PPCAC_23422, partial [Pristionchus entomophagus]
EMSTITCSNFLKKTHLSSYEDGRYLLAAHGPFIELYDIDEYLSVNFNAREYEPIKTRVFEVNNPQICKINNLRHVIAITSEYNMSKKKVTITACPVHRDVLLKGGIIDITCIRCEYYSQHHRCGLRLRRDLLIILQFLLFTETTLTHFRYSFDGNDIVYDVIAKFDLQ